MLRAVRDVRAAAGRAIFVSVLAGSPLLTGHAEPWDADWPFYLLALVVAGAVSGSLAPQPFWGHYAGAVAGQMGYQLLLLPVGPLLVLGIGFVLAYSLAFVAAAVTAGLVREGIGRRLR